MNEDVSDKYLTHDDDPDREPPTITDEMPF